MGFKIITTELLQRKAKSNIIFPEQKAVNTVLFGQSGFTFLFYRGSVPVGLFISHREHNEFHYGWKVFKTGVRMGKRFYEIHDVGSIGFDKSILPVGMLV